MCLSGMYDARFEAAVPPSDREMLQINDQVMPLGVVLGSWESQQLVSMVFKILAEEMLGYNVSCVGPTASSQEAIAWLGGCILTDDGAAAQCPDLSTRQVTSHAHIFLESWENDFAYLRQHYADFFPDRIGLLGYNGLQSMFVPHGATEAAYAQSGMTLTVDRSFNQTWGSRFNQTASPFFTDISTINTSMLLTCENFSHGGNTSSNYLQVTGDEFGLWADSDASGMSVYHPKCWDSFGVAVSNMRLGNWWFSRACRRLLQEFQSPSRCIPCILRPEGWASDEFMQKADVLDMPLAIALAGSPALYEMLPRTYSTLMYWWIPDPTFVDTRAEPVAFEPHDSSEWVRGRKVTGADLSFLTKWAYNDLAFAAERAYNMLGAMSVPSNVVEHMLLQRKQNSSRLVSQVACDWLKDNPRAWMHWIPTATQCSPGQGLVGGGQEFMANRSHAFRCRWCSPGRYSRSLSDEEGLTWICALCPSGTASTLIGTQHCEFCPSGSYNPVEGQIFCATCPEGAECPQEGSVHFVAQKLYWTLGGLEELQARYRERLSTGGNELMGFHSVGPFRCPAALACLGNNLCVTDEAGEPMNRGPMCGGCSQGYQRQKSSDICKKCPEGMSSLGLFAVSQLIFWTFVLVLNHAIASHAGTVRGVLVEVTKILFNFFTLFSVISDSIRLGEAVSEFVENDSLSDSERHIRSVLVSPATACLVLADAVQNPGLGIISLDCVFNSIGWQSSASGNRVLIAWLLVPFVHSFLFAAILALSFLKKLRGRMHHSIATYAFLHFQPLAIIATYFLHPIVTANLLFVWGCERFNQDTRLNYDTLRLLDNMEIDCNSDEHAVLQTFSILGGVIWSVGIPLAFFGMLKASKGSLGTVAVQKQRGFLYRGLTVECYYFESIFMVRRLMYLMILKIRIFTSDTRSVLLLMVNFANLGMHLLTKPFDARAYGGLDSLECQSCYTLIFLLIGRMFLIFCGAKISSLLDSFTVLFYLPAFCAFVSFILHAVYLALREFIWPLDAAPHMTRWCRRRLDHRCCLTILPPTRLAADHQPEMEHTKLEHRYNTPELEAVFAEHALWRECKRRHTPESERWMFQELVAEVIDVGMLRHEICAGKGTEIMGLTAFFLQFERILVCCKAHAIKARILHKAPKHHFARSHISRMSRMMTSSVIALDVKEIDWQNPKCPHLQQHINLIRTPVSLEEMYVALMYLRPKLLHPQAQFARAILSTLAAENAGILELLTDMGDLFHPQSRTPHVQSNIDANYDKNVNVEIVHHDDGSSNASEVGEMEIEGSTTDMLGLELVGAHCVHDERLRQEQLKQTLTSLERKLVNLNATQLKLRGRIEEHTAMMLRQSTGKSEEVPEALSEMETDDKPGASGEPVDAGDILLEDVPIGLAATLTAGLPSIEGLPGAAGDFRPDAAALVETEAQLQAAAEAQLQAAALEARQRTHDALKELGAGSHETAQRWQEIFKVKAAEADLHKQNQDAGVQPPTSSSPQGLPAYDALAPQSGSADSPDIVLPTLDPTRRRGCAPLEICACTGLRER